MSTKGCYVEEEAIVRENAKVAAWRAAWWA